MLLPVPPADLAPARAVVVDLRARRTATDAAVRAAAAAPVRHVTAELLRALQGSWGTPEEVLGTQLRRPALVLAR